MIKRTLLCMIGLLTSIMIQAQTMPEKGKYYQIENQNPDKAAVHEGVRSQFVITEDKNGNWLYTTEPNGKKEYNQVWLCTEVSGTTCKMQNVLTQRYFSTLARSTRAVTGKTAGAITVSNASQKNCLLLRLSNEYFHSDGSNNLVGWHDTSNKSNWWKFVEVEYTEAELTEIQTAQTQYAEFQKEREQLEAIAAKSDTYAGIIAQYFEDVACTQLKSDLAAMSEEAFIAKMTEDKLPEQIQNGVLAIKNKWAGETNPAISERFRIQSYGAYAAAGSWRWGSDGLNASQLTDMNNPTGIFSNKAGLLMVFVEGAVPEGCELRLSSVDEGITGFGYNNHNSGKTLKQGLNVIAVGGELTEYWVMYSVTDKSKKPAEMDKIKIHIEGGNVMGYVTYDPSNEDATNALYKEILLHANKAAYEAKADKKRLRLATKGEYGMCYWQIMTYNRIWSDGSAELMKNFDSCTFETEQYNRQYTDRSGNPYGFKIWKSAKFYDDVLHQEWGVMGFMKDVKEATAQNPVYNCFGGRDLYPTYCNCLAYTIMGTKGGNPHSSTGYTHMPGVGAVESSYNGERADFDVWCVGHESGHNNQGAINLQSSTESSNNLFSNIITYWYGYRMNRGGSVEENENYWQNGIQFSKRDIGMTMMMYYQLYEYYHLLGKKMDFYPTFFCNLRADALNLNSGKDSWLKFYKMACEAAQEDLTEFFRWWGFFETFENVVFGDYTNRTCSVSQAEVDAAIKYVKDKAKQQGWRENLEIMFIECRQQLRPRTDIWASSETNPDHKVKPNNSGNWRTQEQLWQDYGNIGDILDFQAAKPASYEFSCSGTTITCKGQGGVGFLVYNDKGEIIAHSNKLTFNIPASVGLQNYTIKAINADGTLVDVADVTPGGKESQLTAIFQEAVNTVSAIETLVDETGTKVGYYLPSTVAHLEELIKAAKEAIAAKNTAEYSKIYDQMNAEYENVKANGQKVAISKTGLYTIRNNSRKRYLTSDASTAADANSDNAKWAFVKANDSYIMQNAGTLSMINGIYAVSASTTSAAAAIKLEEAGNGCWYLKTNNSENKEQCLNNTPSGEKVIGWSADAGSQWYITKVGEIDLFTNEDVQTLITETQALSDKAGTVNTAFQKLTLQTTDKNAPNYVATNKANTSYPIANLIDNDRTTDFYTKKETSSTTPHNFYVDLGAGNGSKQIRLTITTPNNGLAPKTIVATPGTSTLAYKSDQATTWNDLPDGATQQTTYRDTKEADAEYRYWRFQVTEVNGSTGPQFGLAEIQIRTLNTTVSFNTGYEKLDKNLLLNTQSAIQAARSKSGVNYDTPLYNATTYSELMKAYEALYNAMEELVPTGILDINADDATVSESQKGIYDITGRRVQKFGNPGLYIINGKKVIINN